MYILYYRVYIHFLGLLEFTIYLILQLIPWCDPLFTISIVATSSWQMIHRFWKTLFSHLHLRNSKTNLPLAYFSRVTGIFWWHSWVSNLSPFILQISLLLLFYLYFDIIIEYIIITNSDNHLHIVCVWYPIYQYN